MVKKHYFQDFLEVVHVILKMFLLGHGEDLNHLIWDIKNSQDLFESLPPVGLDSEHLARFVITDGGVTMFKPQK